MIKPGTEALLDKAARSLDAARILQKAASPEFAASRAYYAIFYVAEALLFQIGLTFKSHGAVHGAFGEEFAKTKNSTPDSTGCCWTPSA